MNRSRLAAPLLAGVLLLSGCGSSLEADDPAGYEACVLFAESTKIDGDPLMAMGAMFEIGNHARDATTESIRDTASPVFDEESQDIVEDAGGDAPDAWLVDRDALEAACEASGVDIP